MSLCISFDVDDELLSSLAEEAHDLDEFIWFAQEEIAQASENSLAEFYKDFYAPKNVSNVAAPVSKQPTLKEQFLRFFSR